MNLRSLLFFCLFLVYAQNALAQSASCFEYQEPEVVVTPVFEEPILDHTKTVKDLIDIRQKKAPNLKHDNIPAGLTTFETGLQGQAQTRMQVWSNGDVCAQIARYELKMSIKNMRVYIASEIPEDSCSYRSVLEHEYKHVNVARETQRRVLPIARKYIRDYISYQGVIFAQSEEEAEKRIQQDFFGYVSQMNENVLELSDKLQNDVDTPEEYDRLERACNGETTKIVNRAAR